MRVFAFLFALVLIVAVARAAPESEPNDDCYEETLNISVKPGEVAYPEGRCVRVECSEDGEINMVPCEFAILPNCHVVDGDLTKQYPACCPTLKCD